MVFAVNIMLQNLFDLRFESVESYTFFLIFVLILKDIYFIFSRIFEILVNRS
jgi:hypothetical protein